MFVCFDSIFVQWTIWFEWMCDMCAGLRNTCTAGYLYFDKIGSLEMEMKVLKYLTPFAISISGPRYDVLCLFVG